MTKWVYSFGDGTAEGGAAETGLLGAKGAGLAEMCRIGLPVPPGFTITTAACDWFLGHDHVFPDALRDQVRAALAELEERTGAGYGEADRPLLLSVRPGARVLMPGLMNTVLNLGLNDQTVAGLARLSGDARFAYDSYRRFIQMYSDLVLGIDHQHFEELLELHKDEHRVALASEFGVAELIEVVAAFKEKVEDERATPFPQHVGEQLWGAVAAAFESWTVPHAAAYREIHAIPANPGAAASVQAMVFGNRGEDCGTGVASTRNPSTGADEPCGEYLANAQGEDVVTGMRTPQPLSVAGARAEGAGAPAMEEAMPDVFAQLEDARHAVEAHFRDMQDLEFTVERRKLWMLQTRPAKRTPSAAVKIAVDMARDGLIERAEAVARIDAGALERLLHRTLDPGAARTVIARGLGASPGAVSGAVVFSAAAAAAAGARKPVILVRVETGPEDIHGMQAAKGILTVRGGLTSHAAVVARGMGRPCVAGAGALRVDGKAGEFTVQGRTVRAGDIITIDGSSGEVMLGAVATVAPRIAGDFATLLGWADDVRRMEVRVNAETPEDARLARRFGAQGIGLCRTEHMFMDSEGLTTIRAAIMATEPHARATALERILAMQRRGFVKLFRIMEGLPVAIRLLDPPLHEFLPQGESEIAALAAACAVDVDTVRLRADLLKEANPMLGHRGCRLGVSRPDIYETQVRAILEAAIEAAAALGAPVEPHIMVPLVATKAEFEYMRELVERVADAVAAPAGARPRYRLGALIELPRAALRAGDIAATADFLSFGTNDLTQTVFGLSRDDVSGMLRTYQKRRILPRDPFASLDTDGVGELIRMACSRARAVRPGIEIGICGEHGGDPDSIRFCEEVGLDYLSCSPYRIPVARLAAARAALAQGSEKGSDQTPEQTPEQTPDQGPDQGPAQESEQGPEQTPGPGE